MRRNLALFLPLASLAVALASGPPAAAQSTSDRIAFEPLYFEALRELEKENEAITALNTQLQGETDLVRGCGLLSQSLTHLKAADALLVKIDDYTDKLRRRSERQAAAKQREGVVETIKLREGDIDRMCKDLPPA